MTSCDNPHQISIEEFKLPFTGELDKSSRWVIFAKGMQRGELMEVNG